MKRPGSSGVLLLPGKTHQYGSTHWGLWLSLPLVFVFAAKANQFLAKQISCRGIPSIPRLPRVTWPPTSPMDYAGLSPLYTVHRPVFDYIQILFKTHLRDDMLCQISQRTIQRSWLFCARSLTTLPWQHLLQTLLLKHGLPSRLRWPTVTANKWIVGGGKPATGGMVV